jgi:predicted enzyme related to lactoylglutathione lyase
MARALGIGGIFFRSKDPHALAAWYGEHLGMNVDEGDCVSFRAELLPREGFAVWSPFDADTRYFDPARKDFMFNLIVDDLEGALAQVAAGGGEPVGGIEEHDFGRFGWFLDPDRNKVELWEPRRM